ncbi:pentatricopeptide repeat-containing protein, partial [Tanacetum coccineum]
WYKTSDEVYVSLIERLNECRDFDGIQSLFDDLVDDDKVKVNGFSAFSRIVRCLAKADKLEVSFCCFKKIQESGCKVGRLDTAMKAYMEMQGFGIKPSATMFVSMIESYVKAGKLEMGLKIWDEMKKARFRPNYGLYTMIVESHAIKPRRLGN